MVMFDLLGHMKQDNHVRIANTQICLCICIGLSVFPFHFLKYSIKKDTDKRSESTLLMHYMGAFSQDHKSLPNVY